MTRKKSKQKYRYIRIPAHTRRKDIKDSWGRYSHWKNIKVKAHIRKIKRKK